MKEKQWKKLLNEGKHVLDVLYPINELDFKSQDAFNVYNKQHKLRQNTKVNIGGKQTTAGKASENDFKDKSLTASKVNWSKYSRPPENAIVHTMRDTRQGTYMTNAYVHGDKNKVKKAVQAAVEDAFGGDTVDIRKASHGNGYRIDIPDYYIPTDETKKREVIKKFNNAVNKALKPMMDQNRQDYDEWKRNS